MPKYSCAACDEKFAKHCRFSHQHSSKARNTICSEACTVPLWPLLEGHIQSAAFKCSVVHVRDVSYYNDFSPNML